MATEHDNTNMEYESSEESWVSKYRPDDWGSIQGNNKDVKQIKRWAKNWSPGDSPLLLVGPPGTGKTSTAQVVSKELGFPINQINASSSRKKEDIKRMVSSIQSTPSDADRQLVLLDEVDSWHTKSAAKPLGAMLNSPPNPVIMTANDDYEVPQSLKRPARQFDFKLGKRSRKAKLKKIIAAEGIDVDDDDLDSFADRPDLRSAINDLQRWAEQGVPPKEDERTWEDSPFEVVERIMRGGSDSGFDMAPDDLVLWLDANIRNEYRGVEAAVAYETLAKADEFLQTAMKEDYKYWKYAGALAEQTASLRLTPAYDGYMNVDFPGWFRKSEPKPTNETGEAILYRELSDYEGGSFRFGGGFTYFRKVLLPLIRQMDEDTRMELALQHDLGPKALDALGLDASDYAQWSESAVPEERQVAEARINQESALDW